MRLLYVDDEPSYHRLFKRGLMNDTRYSVQTSLNGEEALRILAYEHIDVVITDIKMPRMDGLTLLAEIRKRYPDIFVLIATSLNSATEAVQAMKLGAYDYILKPLDLDMLRNQLDKLYQHQQVLTQAANTDDGLVRFENLVGRDPAMYKLYKQIDSVAITDTTVLIHGESGTGKELIAEAIHARSHRKNRPFVAVNCAAFTDTLVTSALFGHEKGAFTGAQARHIGHFEQASGGTIFLDEIGDIPQQTQVALLRVLELGSFYRVGGGTLVSVDTRVICATNRDLSVAMKEKLFREDLYYRLNVVSLTAPPLRLRRNDIPLLAEFFLHTMSRKAGKQISAIDSAAQQALCQYDWPGNVRELANAIERAVVFCAGDTILPEHLPDTFQKDSPNGQAVKQATTLAAMERALILAVLQEKDWNVSHAAEVLGVARGTLYSKIERYGLEKL